VPDTKELSQGDAETSMKSQLRFSGYRENNQEGGDTRNTGAKVVGSKITFADGTLSKEGKAGDSKD